MNAKKEFLTITKGLTVKCAVVKRNFDTEPATKLCKFNLKIDYSKKDMERFLRKLDFEYDSGFGAQYIFGIIWLSDGNWITRYEYDGLERWQINTCPPIPKKLI